MVAGPIAAASVATAATDPGGAEDAAAIAAWVERGDRDALQAVFERHAPAALRLATHRLGNLSDADDAVQHAYLACMRGARHYRPERGSVRGYLMTAVINACAELRRSETRRRAREDVVAPPDDGRPAGADPDLRDAVRVALARLPEHQRGPVELRYLAGLDFPEIAAALGRNERTVRGQVTRGLDALRDACGRLGLRPDHAALGVAIAALPVAAPAEAVARASAVATSGPPAAGVAVAKPVVVLGLGLVSAVLAVLAWIASRPDAPLPVPSAATTPAAPVAAPEPRPTPVAAARRERRTAEVFWSVPDEGDAPLVTIGAERPAAAGEPVASWWRAAEGDMGADWWSNPLVKDRPLRPEWMPDRLLRAPRAGEPCFAICVAPPPDAEWTRSLRPVALVAEPDGWRLVLAGTRVSRALLPAGIDRGRSAFACALGAMPAGGARVQLEVHWHDLVERTSLRDARARIELGEVAVAADAVTPAVIARTTGAQPAAIAASPALIGIPPPMRVRQMTAAEAPPRFGGIVNTTQTGWAGFGGPLPPIAGAAVQVLGPLMSRHDAIRLREVRWDGDEVTATVAVWSAARSVPEAERLRPLLPVWIERPAHLVGPARLRLAWEHFVEDAEGTYVRQAGVPAFAGTVLAEGVALPDPDLPEPVAPTM